MRTMQPSRLRSLVAPLAVLLAALALPGCAGDSGHSVAAVPPPSAPPPPPSPNAPDLERGPVVAEATTGSIVIAWTTDPAGVGEVEYSLDQSYSSRVAEPGSATRHVVTISGLEAGATYFYRVRTSGHLIHSGATFAAARARSDELLRFVAFGDSGSGTSAQLRVRDQIPEEDLDLAIHVGDVIYDNGEASNFNPRYFEPYADLIDHVPFYPVMGNHDIRTSNGQPFLDAFYLPHNNPAGTERYYSFDSAHAHFIGLDSNLSAASGSAMRSWLEADLQSPAARSAVWKFAYMHHPPFSSGQHASSTTLRNQLQPVFAAGGVDIVFTGHDHTYERTYPLQNSVPVNESQEPDYVSPPGVIYIVTGGGGRGLYDRTEFNDFTAFFASVHHLVRVEINGRSLSLTAVDDAGREIDSMTLTK